MFEKSFLWRSTLAAQQNDEFVQQRERLRTAYLSLRDNAKQLVSLIPSDCQGLTVHDVTHLDALWEMGSLICGDRFELNPSEAFVFGAAVLLHDAGMSIASYPGGLSQLVETTEWRDNAASVLKKNSIPATPEAITNPPGTLRGEIVFQTLRDLHARHAEELASVQWQGRTGAQLRLIEDQEIRTAFGSSIGRIAHSHHWPINRLVGGSLTPRLGAPAFAPTAWTVNEIKIACMLRCADAAHMDRRRAPSLTYALTKPQGVSDDHWRFQNKLNKPTVEADSITYATGEPFELSEARAWWLCYDTLTMLDNEIRKSNSVLRDSDVSTFAVKQVAGTSDPIALSRYIRVNGWKPVNAEIRVSNPVHLAQTLGGRNLYGNNLLAPVRELLQNATDSVRARRLVSKRSNTWGSIRLRIDNTSTSTWLHVDDTGIGMSEATLTGALLDFGSSFWRTHALRDEWPGLESSGLQVIGKFGIGFFSIFLLGDQVKVISRRCDAGVVDAKVLEFESIRSRPILRLPDPDEVLEDYVTTVSVKLNDRLVANEEEAEPLYRGGTPRTIQLSAWLPKQLNRIVKLVSGVDVDITIEVPHQKYQHSANWTTIEPRQFLTELLAGSVDVDFLNAHFPLLRVLRDENGTIFGRAGIALSEYYQRTPLGRTIPSGISVGGFNVARGPDWCVGILSGETSDASRGSATHNVPKEVLAAWASEQAKLITEDRFGLQERTRGAEWIDSIGGDPGDLPFVFCGGALLTKAKFLEVMSSGRKAFFLLDAAYDESIHWVSINSIGLPILSRQLLPYVCAAGWQSRNVRVFLDDDNEDYVSAPPKEVDQSRLKFTDGAARMFDLLTELWGCPLKITLDRTQIFATAQYRAPPERWVLIVEPR
ncbi:HD domain-containing protein [Bradyrhizobium oligotrophicum]|uniref:HD domain-containing protein n=1 Tax=Bradyrhizobium oligotrophicum TaxID=44255 RepID=UPI003EBD8BE0